MIWKQPNPIVHNSTSKTSSVSMWDYIYAGLISQCIVIIVIFSADLSSYVNIYKAVDETFNNILGSFFTTAFDLVRFPLNRRITKNNVES